MHAGGPSWSTRTTRRPSPEEEGWTPGLTTSGPGDPDQVPERLRKVRLKRRRVVGTMERTSWVLYLAFLAGAVALALVVASM